MASSSSSRQLASSNVPVDEVTGLPLIYCRSCGDVRMIAKTTTDVDSKLYGKRFFKCPRSHRGVRMMACGQSEFLRDSSDLIYLFDYSGAKFLQELHAARTVRSSSTAHWIVRW
jgi:hypothetical protein